MGFFFGQRRRQGRWIALGLVRFRLDRVDRRHEEIDQSAAHFLVLLVDDAVRPPSVIPEGRGDDQQQSGGEQQQEFQLQLRFAENPLEEIGSHKDYFTGRLGPVKEEIRNRKNEIQNKSEISNHNMLEGSTVFDPFNAVGRRQRGLDLTHGGPQLLAIGPLKLHLKAVLSANPRNRRRRGPAYAGGFLTQAKRRAYARMVVAAAQSRFLIDSAERIGRTPRAMASTSPRTTSRTIAAWKRRIMQHRAAWQALGRRQPRSRAAPRRGSPRGRGCRSARARGRRVRRGRSGRLLALRDETSARPRESRAGAGRCRPG